MYLNQLPEDHSDRNRPLAGCWYRWQHGRSWREVTPKFKIARRCFNDLGPAWIDHNLFIFEAPS